MQFQNLGLGSRDVRSNGHFFETVHDLRNFNLVRTTRGAGLASRAHPNRATTQDGFPLPQNHHANDFIRVEIHGKGDRTAIGAFAALKTRPGLKRPDGFYLV